MTLQHIARCFVVQFCERMLMAYMFKGLLSPCQTRFRCSTRQVLCQGLSGIIVGIITQVAAH